MGLRERIENGLATHALAVPTDNQHRLIVPITPEASPISSRYQGRSTDPGAVPQAQAQVQPFFLCSPWHSHGYGMVDVG